MIPPHQQACTDCQAQQRRHHDQQEEAKQGNAHQLKGRVDQLTLRAADGVKLLHWSTSLLPHDENQRGGHADHMRKEAEVAEKDPQKRTRTSCGLLFQALFQHSEEADELPLVQHAELLVVVHFLQDDFEGDALCVVAAPLHGLHELLHPNLSVVFGVNLSEGGLEPRKGHPPAKTPALAFLPAPPQHPRKSLWDICLSLGQLVLFSLFLPGVPFSCKLESSHATLLSFSLSLGLYHLRRQVLFLIGSLSFTTEHDLPPRRPM
mmetsp:Transcript_12996/g.30916  ORF Transcript_12996/g.30916 Transcript_12996/m.30916 type:complete len:263 (-) Transcript_12996:849-1637(-)